MPFEFIPTRPDYGKRFDLSRLIDNIRDNSTELDLDKGVLYYGWPQIQDYDSVRHPVDLTIMSRRCGLILIRYITNSNSASLMEAGQSIAQAAAITHSMMMKSAKLRNRRKLKFDVVPIVFAYGSCDKPNTDSEYVTSFEALCNLIREIEQYELSSDEYNEARSILEGVKTLGRSTKRKIENPDTQTLAVEINKLEEEIASFDVDQRSIALTRLNCPQRIRGLAGSGKTVILAMKAAMAHIENPDAQILFTYYTRSLRDSVVRLIEKFYRHFAEGSPNWERIDVHHGWGRRDTPGVYRETAIRHGHAPLTFMDARHHGRTPFDYVCTHIVSSGTIAPRYDLILIDEGQDFPASFYLLCFYLAKGDRDNKQIVWAYDELQNIFDVNVRSPEKLFGKDDDGKPRISLERSLPKYADTNDFVLQKCYRNQRSVLVLAHAIGFGLYGEPVQMLQNKEHWQDVGYDIISGSFETNQTVRVVRPERNNPTSIGETPGFEIISCESYESILAEVVACCEEIQRFINAGLEPHEIMVIAIDDRSAREYLSQLSVSLGAREIFSNNIIADKYNQPPFLIEGKVTMSTVHRAKGNESTLVFVLGCDAIDLGSRVGRNRLFTAFTRSKAWLRISGHAISASYQQLTKEVLAALGLCPHLEFRMPDIAKIELIQRDLRDKDARVMKALTQVERIKDELKLTDEDLISLIDREASPK